MTKQEYLGDNYAHKNSKMFQQSSIYIWCKLAAFGYWTVQYQLVTI